MQTKKIQGGQELICMNVDKVYDWVLTQADFPLALGATTIEFPGLLDLTISVGDILTGTTTCTVSTDDLPAGTAPVEVVSREDRTFIIDGEEVTLQLVTIQKNFNVTLTVTLLTGTILVSVPTLFSRFEQVILCAPEGTSIDVTYTEQSCFVISTGTLTAAILGTGVAVNAIAFANLSVQSTLCQSIQSTYPVTVEFLAEFCQPRDILPTSCPAPVLPPQCPAIFPDFPTPPAEA